MVQLLDLPQEIKDKIWELTFANQEFLLFTDALPGSESKFSEHDECQVCNTLYKTRYTRRDNDPEYVVRSLERMKPPQTAYNRMLNSVLAVRDPAALSTFQSTITLQLKSPEAIAWFRTSAPTNLQQRAQNVTICVHFDHTNHALWHSRLMELPVTFPSLKKLLIRYHMRPPISYDNLLDALYLSVAIQQLPEMFKIPKDVSHLAGKSLETLPSLSTGTTIETSYMEEQALFSADWLGEIFTSDAISEHTSLIRDLFHDSDYVADVERLTRHFSPIFRSNISQAFRPYQYPQNTLKESFQIVSSASNLQQSLLQIARQHEKPWFEKLMRRRILQVWQDKHGKDRDQEIQEFLATLPEGQGVEEILRVLAQNEELAAMFGLYD